ncbi:hypothetical protein HPB52_008522 [Rhipicephalus sanguineus]|uniref:Uncharacterized protein n=1 Tax=Rhipicephalus sanguineus TaxID=34632 RepID=A0A9D4QE02_RHISA|nr:hypothetical protein HPB52_008522 [Rhipicephalus sanguineus]
MCDKVDGQMRVGGKWNLLKHLLKRTDTRAAQRSAIEILVHRALTLRSKDSIMTDLARIHLPLDTTSSTPPPGYTGSDSDELDGDIAEWELNSRRENALFVDASRSGPNSFVAAVVDMSGRTVSAASVRTRSIGVAEQGACEAIGNLWLPTPSRAMPSAGF